METRLLWKLQEFQSFFFFRGFFGIAGRTRQRGETWSVVSIERAAALLLKGGGEKKSARFFLLEVSKVGSRKIIMIYIYIYIYYYI